MKNFAMSLGKLRKIPRNLCKSALSFVLSSNEFEQVAFKLLEYLSRIYNFFNITMLHHWGALPGVRHFY